MIIRWSNLLKMSCHLRDDFLLKNSDFSSGYIFKHYYCNDVEHKSYPIFNKFQRNGTTAQGLLRAKTGIVDVNDIGQLVSFNGEDKLKFWKEGTCNDIKYDKI